MLALPQAGDAEGAAERLVDFWARAGGAWEAAAAAAHAPGGRTVAVVAHSAIISAMLCRCLGMGPERLSLFRSAPGRCARHDVVDPSGNFPCQQLCLCPSLPTADQLSTQKVRHTLIYRSKTITRPVIAWGPARGQVGTWQVRHYDDEQ